MYLSTLLLTLTLLAAATANACDHLQAIIHNAYPQAIFQPASTNDTDRQDPGFDIPAVQATHVDLSNGITCKIWPVHPQLTLVAVTLQHPPRTQEGEEADLDILVVDTTTGAVKARRTEPDIMTTDAMHTDFQGFDTAVYRLAPGITAFGIRIGSSGGSYHEMNKGERLTLYSIVGQQLQVLLPALSVQYHQISGEDSGHTPPAKEDCGVSRDFQLTLALDHKASPSYPDLLIRQTKIEGTCSMDKDVEGEHWIRHTRHNYYRLRYDGHQYPIPAELE